MVKCEICGLEYHHCDSCGSWDWYDNYRFCSERCAMQSKEYIEYKKEFITLLECIPIEHKSKFIKFAVELDENHDYLRIVIKELIGKEGLEAWGYW